MQQGQLDLGAVVSSAPAAVRGEAPDDPLGVAAAEVCGGPAVRRVLVIGAGPAGLTAAYELTRQGVAVQVVEQHALVGGLARTESYKGYHFDMGGHRFFTKSREVERLWHEILEDDFLRRPRLSRIYYNKKFFYYPLRPLNTLLGLGLWESLRIAASYLRWQLFPYKQEETFEQWVTNRFGRRLFETFFKTYTEKVWGIPCTELKAEWAAQRIKDLSVKTALLNMFFKPRKVIKTLIEQFDYPRLGPGMLWNAVRRKVVELGGQVRTQTEVVRLHRNGRRIEAVTLLADGRQSTVTADAFLSSMPISEVIKRLDPPPPPEVAAAAARLTYRDFLTVCLIVNQPVLFPDNWIYVHDPEVRVGRIQNFKNWSPDMVPDPGKTSLGLEYFCSEGDALWSMSDAELIELGKQELERIGLARAADVLDGCVFRVAKSYPVYDSDYREHLSVVRQYVEGLENFQTIGRNGLHRYNNQDHAMLTGLYAVRNLLHGERHDLWQVNADMEYHEEVRAAGVAADADKLAEAIQEALAGAFLKLDRGAFGVALGVVCGLALFAATLVLVLRGGANVGATLGLLRNYFPGYRVTPLGSVLGLGYGFLTGFVLGWTTAFFRNLAVFLYMAAAHRRSEHALLRKLLEYL
jgi:protoporphyrinogen oxidase